MPPIPRDRRLDSTLALLRDPYEFIARRARRYGSDLFETRLLLQRTICLTGPEAAELFYDERRFMRHGAMPDRVQATLLGRGGVQGLDDAAHRHRKQMFLSLMAPERVRALADQSAAEWDAYARKWATMDRVVLYAEAQELLTRAVCAWAGVPLDAAEVARRTRELVALFDAAGAVGPKHWWARLARKLAERWAMRAIGQVRAGRLTPPAQSAAQVIAWHRDLDGALLSPRVAAVELLNVLRPTVAVSVYIVFVAHALHQHPAWRTTLQAGDPADAEPFVQEVRRFYPFFPAVAARVRQDFAWQGYPFPARTRVLLDLYGTNRDPRAWQAPEVFRPERFRGWAGHPFTFIPQGGGDHALHHRCPGEWITLALMQVAARFLAGRITYDVPPQDLRLDCTRLPALPRSHFILRNVRTQRR